MKTREKRPVRMLLTANVLLLLVAAAAALPASDSPASTGHRSKFCRPHRSLQSFGKELSRRKQGYGAHLVAAPTPVLAGQTPAMRLLNVGSVEISYGPRQTQRWVRGSWKTMPPVGYLQPVQSFLPPGKVTRCIGPVTGRHWPGGKYRWLLHVESFEKDGPETSHILRAVFRLRVRRFWVGRSHLRGSRQLITRRSRVRILPPL